ncbi:hypothetical protein NDU88_006065 [Pleurodeles waltl]|uniref:Uncharacterized protein n=1 Tax=Pleurodeles waltl TaxID=8319 RepID=A0AAV7WZP4_PLEWA|nr:hypothetical protein NDU88_006065 [Pleurodeles waltl]
MVSESPSTPELISFFIRAGIELNSQDDLDALEAALNSPEPRHPCHHCHRYRQESRAAITAPASTISRVAAPVLQLPVASAAARGSDAAPAPGGAYKSPRGRRSGGEAALNSPEPRHPCHHCHRYRQESRAAITTPASTISSVAAPGLQLPVASVAARGSDAAPAPGGAYKSPRGRQSGGEAALNSPELRHPCHYCHRYRQESRAAITAPASTISRVAAPGLQLPVASAAARGSDTAPAPGGAYKSPRGRRSGGEAALNSSEPRHPCHHCHRYRQESRAAITAPASTTSRVAAPGLQLPVASAAARISDAAPAPGGTYKSPRGRRSGGEAALNSPEPRHPCHHCHRYRQESRAAITAPASTISRVAAPGLQLPVASAAARGSDAAPAPGGAYKSPRGPLRGTRRAKPGQRAGRLWPSGAGGGRAGPWTIVEVF